MFMCIAGCAGWWYTCCDAALLDTVESVGKHVLHMQIDAKHMHDCGGKCIPVRLIAGRSFVYRCNSHSNSADRKRWVCIVNRQKHMGQF